MILDKFRRRISKNYENDAITQLIDFLNLKGVSNSALNEATYFACLKVLSESVGKLPLKIQQSTDKGGVRVAYEHQFYTMLNKRPNENMTSSTFWATMENCRNHYGNAYAYIDTSDFNNPQLIPISPPSVRVIYDDAGLFKNGSRIWYDISTNHGNITVSSEDMLHFKSHNTFNGIVGISVREQLAETITGNNKAQALLNGLYENGMSAKAVFQYTGSLNDESVEKLSIKIEDYIKGKKDGVKNLIPLPVGFSLQPLNMKLADSQFLELRQYSALQIASAFGVRPYQIGDYTKSSYASAEAQQLSFLIDTLLFILKQYEEEIAYKLLSDEELKSGYYVNFNTAAILRADSETQIKTLSQAVNNGLYTVNEARALLNLPSVEGGDTPFANGNIIPVAMAGTQYTKGGGNNE